MACLTWLLHRHHSRTAATWPANDSSPQRAEASLCDMFHQALQVSLALDLPISHPSHIKQTPFLTPQNSAGVRWQTRKKAVQAAKTRQKPYQAHGSQPAQPAHLSDVHASKDGSGLTDARQALSQQLRGQVVQVQMDVVLLRAHPAPLADLHCHRPRHHVAGGQVLGCGRVPVQKRLGGVQRAQLCASGKRQPLKGSTQLRE